MPTRVYVHSEYFPDTKLVEIDDQATIEDLKAAALALLPIGTETSGLTLSVEDDDGDSHAQATHVKHLKKGNGIHIHLHRCRHIEVHVHFGAEVVSDQFRPATPVGRVRQWAGHKFGMQPGDILEHVLQITGTNEQPDVDVHIGTLASFPQCSVTFDLVPAHRING